MKSLKWLLPLLFVATAPLVAAAGEKPAAETTILPYDNLMTLAYEEGKKIGYPETIQGLLLHETNGGRDRGSANARRGNQAYGVMQVQLNTAKFVMSEIWGLPKSDLPPDHQLRQKIHNDDVLNIKIAVSYFKYLLSRYSGPAQWNKAVLSYNVGSYRLQKDGEAFDPNDFVDSVRTMIKTDVREFNSVNNIN